VPAADDGLADVQRVVAALAVDGFKAVEIAELIEMTEATTRHR